MLKQALLSLSLGAVSFASPTVATLSSPQPVSLDGHQLVGVTISSWPLVSGDRLATSSAPATLSFKDGSSVKLAEHSSAQLGGTDGQPKLILMGGSLDYKIAAGSNLVIAKSTPGTSSPVAAPVVSNKKSFALKSLNSPLPYVAIAGVAAAGVASGVLTSGSSSTSALTGTVSAPISLATTPVEKAHTVGIPGTPCPAGVSPSAPNYAITVFDQAFYHFSVTNDPNVKGDPLTCWDNIPGTTFYGVAWF